MQQCMQENYKIEKRKLWSQSTFTSLVYSENQLINPFKEKIKTN